jgi:hypothetical protein
VAKSSEGDTSERDADKAPKVDYSATDVIAKLLALLVKLFPEKNILLARILTVFEKCLFASHAAQVFEFLVVIVFRS